MTNNDQRCFRLMPAVLIACVVVASTGLAVAQVESNVAGMRTFGTSGKEVYPFTDGSRTEAELYAYEGSGCLTHMWFGGKWSGWEETRIRVYVDGAQKASIDFVWAKNRRLTLFFRMNVLGIRRDETPKPVP